MIPDVSEVFLLGIKRRPNEEKGGEGRQGVLHDHTVADTTHTRSHTRTLRLTGPRRAVR